MITVIDSTPAEFSIVKSRFLSQAFACPDKNVLPAIIQDITRRYPGATHYAWAYRIQPGQEERSSDDGEPHGTAGLPILRVMTQKQVSLSAIVVVRYFGGIKLGHGGLVRAYQKAAQLAIQEATWGEIRESLTVSLDLPYPYFDGANLYLNQHVRYVEKLYSDRVRVTFVVAREDWTVIEKRLKDLTEGHFVIIDVVSGVDVATNS